MLVKFRRAQENVASRKTLREEVTEILGRDDDLKLIHEDIIKSCHEQLQGTSLTDADICVIVS